METMQGGLMRVNNDLGLLHLMDGTEIIATVNWERVGMMKARDILAEIEKECEAKKPTVRETGSSIEVKQSGKTLLSFYWSDKDKWRYGIRTKEEALELAEEFVNQLDNPQDYPSCNITIVKKEFTCGSVAVFDKDDNKIAIFESNRMADLFLDSIDCVPLDKFDPWGLESSSSAWDRSIRHSSSLTKIKDIPIDDWILSLMQYIDDNWRRCE